MVDDLDPLAYLRLPRLDVANAISLGKMLLAVVPRDTSTTAKKAAKRMHASVEALEHAWRQRVSRDALSIGAANRRRWGNANSTGGRFERRLATR